MKRITATQARREWFRLLDEVAQGEVVILERSGRRIVLRAEPEAPGGAAAPDYSGLISGDDVDQADRWGWDWSPDDGGLVPTEQHER